MVSTRMPTGSLTPRSYSRKPSPKTQTNALIRNPNSANQNLKPRRASHLGASKAQQSYISRNSLSNKSHKIRKLSQRRRKLSPLPARLFEAQIQVKNEAGKMQMYRGSKTKETTLNFPQVSFGEEETIGLSKIQRADKEIRVWESVWQCHFGPQKESQNSREGQLKEESDSQLRNFIQGNLDEAKAKRARLEETDENLRVEESNFKVLAIDSRIKALQWGISTSKFEPECQNMNAVIAGYKSGAIKYSTNLTILYAGHIVDTAPDYASFAQDRQKRLDHYASLHGSGWLFYESPLDVPPSCKPMMMKSLALSRVQAWHKLGAYYLNQGYQKQHGFVSRIPQLSAMKPSQREPFFQRGPNDTFNCQGLGPRLSFRALLDSGATYPSLYSSDLLALGIDENNYSCQALETMNTANGEITSRVFELLVCVLDEKGGHLVDPNDPMLPHFHHHLGGLCPVVEIRGSPPLVNGFDFAARLSGLLPFLACYVSSTPNRGLLYFGENRKDVLGGHRMPGQEKWDIALPTTVAVSLEDYKVLQNHWGDPKITFTHRGGAVVDKDHDTLNHASTLTYRDERNGGPDAVIEVNPRADMDRARLAAQIAELQEENKAAQVAELEEENKAAQAQAAARLRAIMFERGINLRQ